MRLPHTSVIRTLSLLAALVLLAAPARAQLKGDYGVGDGADFDSVKDALAALVDEGIEGPVTFFLSDEEIDVGVTVEAFSRFGDPADEVRFTTDGDRVVWSNGNASAAENHVVRVEADGVAFENIDFVATGPASTTGRLLVLADAVTGLVVQNCTFKGHEGADSNAGSLVYDARDAVSGSVHQALFEGNTFTGGYLAIDYDGTGAKGVADGWRAEDNTFTDQYQGAVRLTSGGFAVGGSVENGAVLVGNVVTNTFASAFGYIGFDLAGGSSKVIANEVLLRDGRAALRLGSFVAGGGGFERQVYNNMFAVYATSAVAAVEMVGGITLLTFNTMYVAGNSAALQLPTAAGEEFGDIRVVSNLMVHANGGRAIEIPHLDAIYQSDGNNVYTTGSVLARVEGVDYSTLGAYQAATGQDAQSNAVAVDFVSGVWPLDLHLGPASRADQELVGIPFGVDVDVDGDPRSQTSPKMGADEGFRLGPLGGTYTVYAASGQPAPDFPTLADARDALDTFGMSGGVVLALREGTHTEQVAFGQIEGSAANRRLVIRPEAGPVTLEYGATSADVDNFILDFVGTDYVTVQGLTFRAGIGNPTLSRCIVVRGSSEHVVIDGNTLVGKVTGGADFFSSLIYANGSWDVGLEVTGNTLVGRNPLNVIGPISSPVAVLVEDNVIGSPGSISLRGTTPTVRGLRSLAGAGVGLYVYEGAGGVFEDNTLVGKDNNEGLQLTDQESEGAPIRIVNNTLFARVAGLALLGTTTDAYVAHNTIVSGADVGNVDAVLRMEGSGHIVLNNIVYALDGHPYAALSADAGAIAQSDGNVLYTEHASAPFAVVDGTAYADLAAYQAATGLDAASVAVPVAFVDTEPYDSGMLEIDLHLDGASLGDSQLGVARLADVPADVDGEARPAFTYRGADEADPPLSAGDPFVVTGPAPLGAYALGSPITVRWTPLAPDITAADPVRVSVLCPGRAPFVRYASTPNDGQAGLALPLSLGTHGSATDQASGCTAEVALASDPSRASESAPFVTLDPAVTGVSTRRIERATPLSPPRYGFNDVLVWFWDPASLPDGHDARLSIVCDGRAEYVRYAATENDGVASTRIPQAFGGYDVCRTQVASATDPALFGRSAPFPILDVPLPSIDLVTPVAGEAIQMGADYAVEWVSESVPADVEVRVVLRDVTGGGPNRILALVPNGGGGFVWSVPTDLSAGDEYRLALFVLLDDGTAVRSSVYPVTFSPIPASATASATAEEPPDVLTVAPARPNPVRGRATVRVGVPEAGPVSVEVYDVQGRRVAVALAGDRPAGWHAVSVDGAALSPGVYVVRARSGSEVVTRTLTVVR